MTGKQKASLLFRILGKNLSDIISKKLPAEIVDFLSVGSPPDEIPNKEDVDAILNEIRFLDEGSTPSFDQRDKASLPEPSEEEPIKEKPPKEELKTLEDFAIKYPHKFVELVKKERKQMIMYLLSKFSAEQKQNFSDKLLMGEEISLQDNLPIIDKLYPKVEKMLIAELK